MVMKWLVPESSGRYVNRMTNEALHKGRTCSGWPAHLILTLGPGHAGREDHGWRSGGESLGNFLWDFWGLVRP